MLHNLWSKVLATYLSNTQGLIFNHKQRNQVHTSYAIFNTLVNVLSQTPSILFYIQIPIKNFVFLASVIQVECSVIILLEKYQIIWWRYKLTKTHYTLLSIRFQIVWFIITNYFVLFTDYQCCNKVGDKSILIYGYLNKATVILYQISWNSRTKVTTELKKHGKKRL